MNCERPQTPDLAPAPTKTIEDWVKFGPGWAVQAAKIIASERDFRRLEHACEREYRKKFLEWDALPGTLTK